MATTLRDVFDRSLEDIHIEAKRLVEKIEGDLEDIDFGVETTRESLKFINFGSYILGRSKLVQ